MIKSGSALLLGDRQRAFLKVGLVVAPSDFEGTRDPWERFAEDIHQINCAVHEYGQRSRPWLRQKKGRGAR